MVSLLVAFGLLLFGGVIWLVALGAMRRRREAMERRVQLVVGRSASRGTNTAEKAERRASTLTAGSKARALFSWGISQTWAMRAGAYTLIAVALGAGLSVGLLARVATHFSYWIVIPACLAAAFFGPRALLKRQQQQAEQQFLLLFPDAIDMATRMMRAGLPITAAVRSLANETTAPVNTVFGSLADQVEIGIPFEAALATCSKSVGLADFRFFCVAISLQRSIGGNLAATLESLAAIIRRRRTVRLQAKAATGEVRMSAGILGSLPFFVTGVFMLISPGYLTPLMTDPRGKTIIGIAVGGLLLAYLTMRRMLRSVTTV